jgi:hypothetical protein
MRSALNHSSWCAYRQPTRVLSPGAASRRPHAVVAARGLLSQELRAVAIRIRESTSWAMSSPFNAVIGRRMFAAPPRGEERSTAQSSTYPGRARIKRDFQSEQQLKNFDERKSSQFDGLQLLDYNKAMIACARSSDAERASLIRSAIALLAYPTMPLSPKLVAPQERPTNSARLLI